MINKLIIADDSKDFRKALKTLLNEIYDIELKHLGSTVTIDEVENGLELLEKIETYKPELIFMDIEMPYMNGFEATKKITAKYPNIRIIGMSNYEKEIYIQKLIDVGADGYLIKTENNYEIIKELLAKKIDSFVFSGEINHHLPLLKSYKTILFVDILESRHLNLRHFLFKCGYTIIKAQNITESIFYIKEKKIDIVIIDHSIIKRNKKFLPSISDIAPELKIILINDKDTVPEFKDEKNNQAIRLKKDASPETIVRLIEE